jgi:hypothetical protein
MQSTCSTVVQGAVKILLLALTNVSSLTSTLCCLYLKKKANSVRVVCSILNKVTYHTCT